MGLNSYFFDFDPSGNERVDSLLEAIALAGRLYPLTEDWSDAGPHDSAPVDWIQDAANDLAWYINRLEKTR